MPDEKELAAFGFKASDYGSQVVEVWPDNWPTWAFWCDFASTQWRVGINGPTGLDHTAVIADLRTLRLPRKDFDELFADVRMMERLALTAMREGKD